MTYQHIRIDSDYPDTLRISLADNLDTFQKSSSTYRGYNIQNTDATLTNTTMTITAGETDEFTGATETFTIPLNNDFIEYDSDSNLKDACSVRYGTSNSAIIAAIGKNGEVLTPEIKIEDENNFLTATYNAGTKKITFQHTVNQKPTEDKMPTVKITYPAIEGYRPKIELVMQINLLTRSY